MVVTDGIVAHQILAAILVGIKDIVLSVRTTNTAKLENPEVLLSLVNLAQAHPALVLANHNLVHQVNLAQVLLAHLPLQSHKLVRHLSVKELRYV